MHGFSGGVLLGALGPVCCLAQYVVWPSMLFGTVFRFVQRVVGQRVVGQLA
jgi:hypothetical protein